MVAAIALATAGLATGCSSSGSSSGSSAGSNTLTIWTYADPKQAPFIKKLESDFKETHPDVTIKYLVVPFDQLTNKIITAASTRTGPDLIVYDPANTASLVQAGALADITKEWDGFKDKSEFPEYATRVIDGKTYSTQAYVNTTALYYNKDILDKAGISNPPSTFEELQSDLKQVVGAGFKGIAQCGAPTSECETQAVAWILGNGGNYNDFQSPDVKKVFQDWYDLGKAGALGADSVGWTQPDAWSAFTKGDYAFTQNGNWQYQSAKDLTFKWGVAPLPGGKVAPGGEGQALGAFSKNRSLAWDYLSSTWLSKAGQVQTFEMSGSIPTRKDAQADPSVANDPNIVAWTTELKDTGTRSEFKDPSDYLKATTAVGQQWSALRQGTTTPDAAASTLADSLKGVFVSK